ncbi:MAG: uncharacterized protein JWR61_2911 [Ferruginibacter sp.]|uniref:DUF3800 domain-containing protein n=1 Tax=Ferruginibacter sp. TaxID=1940288 RepID=UPI002659D134|nr:DUF3800 domain-containing protein [Ferruginibacter sp.]MDB5277956.1 uncharacterized protein [Ferruginibacter sp.]
MYLIFFDEVKCQPDYPFYHLGGIAIAEENFLLIEEEVNKISNDVFKLTLLCPKTEFHAVDIFHGKKLFKHMTNVPDRLVILSRLLKVLMMPEVLLIDIQINTAKLYNKSYAEKYAFMFLCERASALMKTKKSLGMLIGDRENDKNAERYSTTLSQYREKGTDYQYGGAIPNLFESVHFTHSHLSRFLQLADVHAWFLQFKKRHIINHKKQHEPFIELLKSHHINLSPSKYKIWPP